MKVITATIERKFIWYPMRLSPSISPYISILNQVKATKWLTWTYVETLYMQVNIFPGPRNYKDRYWSTEENYLKYFNIEKNRVEINNVTLSHYGGPPV